MPGETKTPTSDAPNYKDKCRTLKRKLRFLIYEQECFQEELRRTQRKLLKVSRDKNFLLDRLLCYERVVFSVSDSESTESSEDEKQKEATKNQQTGTSEKSPKTEKIKKKAKRRPAKKLQTVPNVRQVKNVLPVKLQSPPNSLKQQMPQLVEMLNRASSGAALDPMGAEPFEGLQYTPAFAFPQLAHSIGSVPPPLDHNSPPGTVLPSLLLAQHQFPHTGMIRKLAHSRNSGKLPSRKKAKKSLQEKLEGALQISETSQASSQPPTSSPVTPGTSSGVPAHPGEQPVVVKDEPALPAEGPENM